MPRPATIPSLINPMIRGHNFGKASVFLIRQSKPTDVGTLLKLARMVYFINLPPNEQIIGEKIEHSARCFQRAAGAPDQSPPEGIKGGSKRKRSAAGTGFAASESDSDFFMFTMEELETGGVIGTSQIRAHQGGPGNPNWSMQILEKQFRSEPLGFGSTHKVGKLYGDESGPSEIGGLILQPSHRGHPSRPGRFLSFVRFHFIGLHRRYFADRILAEMMAPVSSEGDNLFWDHVGRKFIPVKYAEADRFCQHNRRFIPELLPKEEIYFSLLPLEVQNMIGVVSRETIPARRLLESLGFRYRGFIDPFDGGPHLDADTDNVPLIRATRKAVLGKAIGTERCEHHGIVSVLHADGGYRAVETDFNLEGDTVRLPGAGMNALGAAAEQPTGYTPLPRIDEAEPVAPVPQARKGRAKQAVPANKPVLPSPSGSKKRPNAKARA